MKVWSWQLWLRFKQSQLSPKSVFGASTGFEPMASALALQRSTNWAMKTLTLGAGQFVEFIVPVIGIKHVNIMVAHRTGIAEVMGSNPVKALIFFRLLPSNCLNWKICRDDHSSLSSTTSSYHWATGTPVELAFKVSHQYCWLDFYVNVIQRNLCKNANNRAKCTRCMIVWLLDNGRGTNLKNFTFPGTGCRYLRSVLHE